MRDDVTNGRQSRDYSSGRPHNRQAAGHQQPEAQAAEKPKKSHGLQQKILIGITALAILSTATIGFLYYKKAHPTSHYFPANITKANVTIPVYYPVNLPAGYAIGSFSVVKKNILTYDITDPGGEEYFVTMQALPVSFDFTGFAKKFAQPDQYSTPIGNDLVGVAGSQLIGSIQTNQNVWIILNAKNSSSQKNMETITRSLQQVNL